jgi:hypothetical protein
VWVKCTVSDDGVQDLRLTADDAGGSMGFVADWSRCVADVDAELETSHQLILVRIAK